MHAGACCAAFGPCVVHVCTFFSHLAIVLMYLAHLASVRVTIQSERSCMRPMKVGWVVNGMLLDSSHEIPSWLEMRLMSSILSLGSLVPANQDCPPLVTCPPVFAISLAR